MKSIIRHQVAIMVVLLSSCTDEVLLEDVWLEDRTYVVVECPSSTFSYNFDIDGYKVSKNDLEYADTTILPNDIHSISGEIITSKKASIAVRVLDENYNLLKMVIVSCNPDSVYQINIEF